MKCPYRNFEECLVEKCPSCNYEEIKTQHMVGKWPHWMDLETAIKKGSAWKETRTTYKFVSCKLVENGVQPAPSSETVINNKTTTVVQVKRSIF